MSNKEELLRMMQDTCKESAIQDVIKSGLLPDNITSLLLSSTVERAIIRVYTDSRGCPAWRTWALLWLTDEDRSVGAADVAAKTVQDDLDRGSGWSSAESTYGAILAAEAAAEAAWAGASVLQGSPTKSVGILEALELGRTSSAVVIMDDVGKIEEVERQFFDLLFFINQEMQ